MTKIKWPTKKTLTVTFQVICIGGKAWFHANGRYVTDCSQCQLAVIGCIQLPKVQKSVAQQSFTYNRPAVWNSLPTALQDTSVSPHTFKQRLKTLLFAAWTLNTIRCWLFLASLALLYLTYLLNYLFTYYWKNCTSLLHTPQQKNQ